MRLFMLYTDIAGVVSWKLGGGSSTPSQARIYESRAAAESAIKRLRMSKGQVACTHIKEITLP